MNRRLYRLEPRAEPTDSAWDRAPCHGIIIVRADSPADARIVASQAEPDFLESDAKPGDGASTRFASAFRDEKLYSVVEEPAGRYEAAGERGLVEGVLSPHILKTAKPGLSR